MTNSWRAEARIKGSIRCSSWTTRTNDVNRKTLFVDTAAHRLCADPCAGVDVADPHAPCRARPDVLGVRPWCHHRFLAQPPAHDASVLRRLTALYPDQRAPRRRTDPSDSAQVRL